MTPVNNPIAQTVNYRLLIANGSAGDPVILPVFKTGGRHLAMAMVGSTPTRFRHLIQIEAIRSSFGQA